MPHRNVLILPLVLADELIHESHVALLSGHEGVTRTKERLLQSYFWPNMEEKIGQHVAACNRCQSRRTTDRPRPPLLTPMPQCTALNQRIHIDLMGGLRTSNQGKNFVLCMTDAFTKYAEICAIPNKEAATVARALFERWICRFGCPIEFTSDNGKEFCNELTKELFKLLQIKHSHTTPYHPQCNAQAEVQNKVIAKYLTCFVDKTTLDWPLYIAPMAFAYNTALHRSIKATPFFLTYGINARLPSLPDPDLNRYYGQTDVAEWYATLQHCRQIAAQNNLQASNYMQSQFNKKASPYNYSIDQSIWIDVRNYLGRNKKLSPNWEGPYKITRAFDNGVVEVLYKNNKKVKVNVARIKPYIPPFELHNRDLPLPPVIDNPPLPPVRQLVPQFRPQRSFTSTDPRILTPPPPRFVNAPVPNQLNLLPPNANFVPQPLIPSQQTARPAARQPARTAPSLFQPSRVMGRTLAANFPPPQFLENHTQPDPLPLSVPMGQPAPPPPLPPPVLPPAAAGDNILPETMRVTRSLRADNQLTLHPPLAPLQKECPFTANPAVASGPSFVSDVYGLPITKPGHKTPAWVKRRRIFLKKLTPAARNLLLTGDPLFSFDNVPYDAEWHPVTVPAAPPIVHAPPVPPAEAQAAADPVTPPRQQFRYIQHETPPAFLLHSDSSDSSESSTPTPAGAGPATCLLTRPTYPTGRGLVPSATNVGVANPKYWLRSSPPAPSTASSSGTSRLSSWSRSLTSRARSHLATSGAVLNEMLDFVNPPPGPSTSSAPANLPVKRPRGRPPSRQRR